MAVIGSVLSMRYENHLTRAIAAHHVPAPVMQVILGSLGGALESRKEREERRRRAGSLGASAFMSVNATALAVGGAVALGGGLLARFSCQVRAPRQGRDEDLADQKASIEASSFRSPQA